MTSADRIHQLRLEEWNLSYTQWKTETLFSIEWWGLVVLISLSYTIWWILVDKERLSRILLFGSFVAVQRVVMGIFGNNAGLWSYPIHLLPIYPNPFQDDFTVSALAMMVVFQFCYSWKKFLIWAGVVSGTLSFILFPIFIKFGILKLYNWSLFYSFVLIFWIATFSRWVLLEVLNIEKRTRNTNDEREHLNKQPK